MLILILIDVFLKKAGGRPQTGGCFGSPDGPQGQPTENPRFSTAPRAFHLRFRPFWRPTRLPPLTAITSQLYPERSNLYAHHF